MPHRATFIRPFNLDPRAAKFVESAVAYAASAAKQNMPTPAYAPQQTAYIQTCAGQLSYKSLLVKKNSAQLLIVVGSK